MRLGVIGYTNLCSGIGLFVWELFHYLDGDSILSVGNPKGPQQVWTERQVTSPRPPSSKTIGRYLDTFKPTVVLFVETPFSEQLIPMCRQRGIKVVGIPMHETSSLSRLEADLYICPSYEAYAKSRAANNILLFLPIGLELFPFKKRTGHTFLFNIGYGGPGDRRQGEAVIQAFISLGRGRMIVNSQVNFPGHVEDPRIEYRLQNYPEPKNLYQDGDICIAPTAYGGYERIILESMACGLPCLTMDADPMNLFQHDRDFLITPTSKTRISSRWVDNTTFNAASVEVLREKFEFLLTIDTQKYSTRARAQAVAQSWEGPIDFKSIWLKALSVA